MPRSCRALWPSATSMRTNWRFRTAPNSSAVSRRPNFRRAWGDSTAGPEQFGGVAPLDIPPRLGELERRLTLAHLVAAWAKGPVLAPLVVGGPASTLALAGDLARLMDDMVTRGVAGDALVKVVPDEFDKYWQHSLDFLRIAHKAWPDHLREIGRIEPAARRDLLIEAGAARPTPPHAGPR